MGKQGLGEFELLVLLAALRLGEDEAYPVTIVDEIAARTGRSVQRASVYVTLQRLEAAGVGAALLGALRGFLFGVGSSDPASLSAALALLLLAALGASAIPALRAGRVDPLTSLRAD